MAYFRLVDSTSLRWPTDQSQSAAPDSRALPARRDPVDLRAASPITRTLRSSYHQRAGTNASSVRARANVSSAYACSSSNASPAAERLADSRKTGNDGALLII